MIHCQMMQTDDIQVVVGDADRDGLGGQQYCGVWSLASKHWQFNAFGNSYAGLLPGELRGKAPRLEVVDDTTCRLYRAADERRASDIEAIYTLSAPYSIDHTLTLRDAQDLRAPGCDFREVSWCNYMNCPDDIRLHFLSRREWHRYNSPEHGTKSNIAPAYVPDDELEVWPDWKGLTGRERPFHWDRYEQRFDEPFYYGRCGPMVAIFIFDTPQWLRFFCSPSGGGPSLLPGHTCPAWDFEWVIPAAAYEVGHDYRFRVRLVYKPYVSDDDVLREYRQAQDELGFERP
jgi:hypothetical protein